MPSGGTIVLRTRVAAGRVVVEVCDSGVGMTEEVKRKCLEPFFTTKGNKGSGLGLGMVYGIVNRHDGTLGITSSPGRGTSIALDFPPAEAGAAATPAIRPRALLSPMHVLVVDDRPESGALLREMLQADGHSAEIVATGMDALTRLAAETFDLVITDRSMPAMSGDELARVIHDSAAAVPVIMVTGFGVLMTSANERPYGVEIVLPKPVTRAALRDALATVHPDKRDRARDPVSGVPPSAPGH
jgi:CheY-like chemotaxis protein